jgi:hypothetical protein
LSVHTLDGTTQDLIIKLHAPIESSTEGEGSPEPSTNSIDYASVLEPAAHDDLSALLPGTADTNINGGSNDHGALALSLSDHAQLLLTPITVVDTGIV